MCRFTAYMGRSLPLDELLFRPQHSIVRQSYASREGRRAGNGDGFGVGWYVPEIDQAPALYRNVRPAWADTNMAQIAPRTRTPLFFAHVRAATPGIPVNTLNCHPFVQGKLMFMHNGRLGAHEEVMRALRHELPPSLRFSIQGTTDSEHLFAAVLHALGARVLDPTPRDLGDALVQALSRVEALRAELGYEDEATVANVALTDGRSMVGLRYATPGKADPASLYLGRARSFSCENGLCVADGPGERGSVLLASEALWDQETAWQQVPANHAVLVDPGLETHLRPLSAM